MTCLNLKNIKKKELNRYPCLLANESTLITQRLAHMKCLTSQFNMLINNKANTKEKLAEINSKIDSNTIPIKLCISTSTTAYKNNNNSYLTNKNVSIKEVNYYLSFLRV